MSNSGLESVVDANLLSNFPDVDSDLDLDLEDVPLPQLLASKDKKAVKRLSRTHGLGVQREERKLLWKNVIREEESEANKSLYQETVTTCFGDKDLRSDPPSLPGIVDASHTNAYCLKNSGRVSVVKILTAYAYNSPEVQYCPVLYPVVATVRHFLSEEESYCLLCTLMSTKQPKYFSQSKAQHEVDWRTALQLNKLYNKKAMAQIVSMSSESDVEDLFRNWLWWIFDYLPFAHVVRILDCFLVEGEKVLFRMSLSLVRSFVKSFKSNRDAADAIKNKGIVYTFNRFCRKIAVSPNQLLERGFRFRGLSRSQIEKISQQIEVPVEDNSTDKQIAADVSTYPLQDLKSQLLSKEQLTTLWSWLPVRLTTVTPTLAYSSDEHGISLTTFFDKAEKFQQSFIVIKTTEQNVFGAFCSASWAERRFKDDRGNRQTYFGTGETFLFTFDKDTNKGKKFAWVGLDQDQKEAETKALQHARELFISAQNDMITIGGGEGNGIFLDSSLTFGKTEKCSTFDNSPLCPKGDFKIACIEVIGITKLDI